MLLSYLSDFNALFQKQENLWSRRVYLIIGRLWKISGSRILIARDSRHETSTTIKHQFCEPFKTQLYDLEILHFFFLIWL